LVLQILVRSVIYEHPDADRKRAPSGGGQSKWALGISLLTDQTHGIWKSGMQRIFHAFDIINVRPAMR
jgi:hypothetical protein